MLSLLTALNPNFSWEELIGAVWVKFNVSLFSLNNETLNFTHTAPISSSQEKLGLRAVSNDSITYQSFYLSQISGNTTIYITAPPSEISTYTGGSPRSNQYIYKNNNVIETGPMAFNRFDTGSYKYRNSNNPLINYDRGSINSNIVIVSGNSSTTLNTGRTQVYYFSILNLNNTGSNNGGYNYEPNPNSYYIGNDGDYYYKVPRSSNYEFKGLISFTFKAISDFWWQLNSPTSPAAAFKIVGVLEKCAAGQNPSQENNWTYLDATYLQNNFRPWQVGYNNANTVWFWNQMSSFASFYCELDTVRTVGQAGISLNTGDLIRFRFYFIDISNIFGYWAEGNPQSQQLTRIRSFEFFFNNSSLSPSTQIQNSYFQVKDLNAPTTIYTYDSSYGQIPILFTTSSINTLLFNPSSSYLFTTSSTFNPQPPTSQYYSPVTDQFGIQKYDLIRIGSFNSPASTYHEVLNVSSSNSGIYVTLNNNIDTGSFNTAAQNFAIFRPKLDETSVIINFKKQLGEVSQTILIPNDASNTIKDAVGNIFKTLNPDLQQ